LLFGRSMADLGRPPFWPPGFSLPCPRLTLVETLPTRHAAFLRVARLTDADLGIADYKEVAIDHIAAYRSASLFHLAVDWLKG